MKKLLNLSGHPAPKGTEESFEVISTPVQNVDMASEIAVAEAAKELLISSLVNAEVKEALLRGEVSVLLPGATPLAAAVLALLVGISGTLPELYWAVRTEDGFKLSSGLKLGQLRLAGRDLR